MVMYRRTTLMELIEATEECAEEGLLAPVRRTCLTCGQIWEGDHKTTYGPPCWQCTPPGWSDEVAGDV